MKRYRMIGVDGGTITASSPFDIIVCLREFSRHACDDIQEFMEATANACQLQNGAIINTYTQEQFVEDLIHHGFLIELPATAEDHTIHNAFRGTNDQ